MTDLLSPARLRQAVAPDDGPPRLSVGSAIAGLAAAGAGLALCWVVALVGWYSSDGGSHGTTRSALRIGADAWLLAHGSHLATGDATITAVPLGLTLLAAYLAYRCGRRAGHRCAGEDLPRDVRPDLQGVGLGVVVLSGVYAVTAVLVAVLASTTGAEPGLGRSFAGAAVVSALGGGLGLLHGSGRLREAWRLLPREARACAFGAGLTVLGMLALGLLTFVLGLALGFGTALDVLEGLDAGVAGSLFSVLLVLLTAPNLALFGASYLLGPGFAVGTGTVVSPDQVVVGQVPAVPIFAALPGSALGQPWASLVMLLPVVVAGLATWRLLQRYPTRRFDRGVGRGAGAGALAAVLLTCGLAVAGGAIGPGRMTDLGPAVFDGLLVSLGAFGLTGGVVGAAAVWWRRRTVEEAEDQCDEPEAVLDPTADETTVVVDLGSSTEATATDEEPTVQVPLPRSRRPARRD